MKEFRKVEEFIVAKLNAELPKDLYYHGIHHTYDVLKSAELIASHSTLTPEELLLLKVAILYHDCGFTFSYSNHEEAGNQIARSTLPDFGFNEQEIDAICGMITATKIPQDPHNLLEEIICDADLEYLGTDRFDAIGNSLFEELKIYGNIQTERQWDLLQINFLKNHHYYTDFCRREREPQKALHLANLIRKVGE